MNYDFKLNYPSISREEEILKLFLSTSKSLHIKFPQYDGLQELKKSAWKWLNLPKSLKSKNEILICNSGNHAISCILHTLKGTHHSIITERYTYPIIKSLSNKLDFDLIGCEMDDEGIIPSSLDKLLKERDSKILYIQPTIHNPTCSIMPLKRRLQIVDLAKKYDLTIIEDDAYRFLHPNPPSSFLDLIPEQTIHIESLSKPYNPLIKTAFVISPIEYAHDLKQAIIQTSSRCSTLLSQFANFILKEAHIDPLINDKQDLARYKQSLIKENLKGLDYQTVETAFHLWIEISNGNLSDTVASNLNKHGIQVSNGNAYLVGNSNSDGKQYIRIAIANEKDMNTLKHNIGKIKSQILEKKSEKSDI